jgi:flagellar protein FliO/FliZ
MGVQGGLTGKNRLVSVVERVPLDQKKSMYVVRVAGEYLLVGGADGALSLICKLSTDAVEQAQKDFREAHRQSAMKLSPFLQKLLSRKDNPPPPPGV